MFVSAVQYPLQTPLHFAVQSPLALAEQLEVHSVEQLAWHWATQSVWLAALLQCAEQLPSHCVLHSPSQENEALPLHFAWQLVISHCPSHDTVGRLQLPWQSTDSFALQAAVTLIGVHCAVQPPWTSALHVASAETSMFPQLSKPACAGSAIEEMPRATPRAAKRRIVFIEEASQR